MAQFRERLAKRGIKLMLDFVPNHTSLDHPWVTTHPDYYAEGGEQALARVPQDYLRVETDRGPKILAHGRDPNFSGWPDTLQLDYANPELQSALIDELIATDYQDKLVRFLENRHEPRAAAFPWPQHQAAAVIAFLSPDLRFFLQGQFEGARAGADPSMPQPGRADESGDQNCWRF